MPRKKLRLTIITPGTVRGLKINSWIQLKKNKEGLYIASKGNIDFGIASEGKGNIENLKKLGDQFPGKVTKILKNQVLVHVKERRKEKGS